MTKTLTITCDICENDITNIMRLELVWVMNYPAYGQSSSSTLYFCGDKHLYQYLDDKKPKEE